MTRDRPFSDSLPRTVRHVILGFRTHDGRDIRMEDTSGVPRVVGDHVWVRYLPSQPQQAAVADAAPAGQSIGLVLGLVVGAGFVCVGLLIAGAGLGVGFFASEPAYPEWPAGPSVNGGFFR
ncbi:DUF3592 domain-containing protein [Kitasatospora sp. NPDC048365]|uniref:DUF3592 domain-containing protein n=1 Tax=Kitasatospora sp. NPDC048365 TaxID=3364050 RepID=UPI00371C4130